MSRLPGLLAVAALVSGVAQAADLQIRFLDVGQGDAILVTTPDGALNITAERKRAARARENASRREGAG